MTRFSGFLFPHTATLFDRLAFRRLARGITTGLVFTVAYPPGGNLVHGLPTAGISFAFGWMEKGFAIAPMVDHSSSPTDTERYCRAILGYERSQSQLVTPGAQFLTVSKSI
jgi:hypothetical protein